MSIRIPLRFGRCPPTHRIRAANGAKSLNSSPFPEAGSHRFVNRPGLQGAAAGAIGRQPPSKTLIENKPTNEQGQFAESTDK